MVNLGESFAQKIRRMKERERTSQDKGRLDHPLCTAVLSLEHPGPVCKVPTLLSLEFTPSTMSISWKRHNSQM